MKFKGLTLSVPETEFSEEFVQSMADRMGYSFFKYGAVADAYPHKVSALESLKKRLALYENGGNVKGVHYEPGNQDFLFDIGNFAMIEFMRPSRKVYCSAGDTAESPGRVWKEGGESEKRNVQEFKYRREGD